MADRKNRDRREEINEPDENRDPISGQPGAHPVGTGIGAAGVGAVGAVVGGVIGGPVGAVVGSAVGAVAGGLIGKGAAESVDPTVEDAYWREQHSSRPYYEKGRTYEDYQPAYRTGYEGYSRYGATGRTFEDAEPDLRRDYDTHRTTQTKSQGFTWDKAKHAARDAWDRVDNNVRGDRYNADSTYWRENYASRPYYEKGRTYEEYEPAYRFGYDSYSRYGTSGRTFAQIEPDLRRDYESRHGKAGLAWEKAKHAVQDAWDRATNTFQRDRDMSTTAGQNAQQVNLYEERLVAEKDRVKTGEVNVGKHVETQTARVDVPVERERVVIDRTTPTGATPVEPGSVDFREGEVARMEVYEEQADIHKEAVVREEVRIRKEVEQKTVQAEEQIRREELDIDAQGQNVVDRTDRKDRNKRRK
jgi:uncharacterized protein (TIGR02271 family)